MSAALSHLMLALMLWLGLGWATAGHAQTAAASGELPSFAVTINDGVFAPPRLEVPAGQRVRLVLKNEGPGPLEFENAEMRIEKILGAGGTSFVVLPRLQPGEYEFIDEFNIGTGLLVIIAK